MAEVGFEPGLRLLDHLTMGPQAECLEHGFLFYKMVEATDDLFTLQVYHEHGRGLCLFNASNKWALGEVPCFLSGQSSWHLPDLTPESLRYLRRC